MHAQVASLLERAQERSAKIPTGLRDLVAPVHHVVVDGRVRETGAQQDKRTDRGVGLLSQPGSPFYLSFVHIGFDGLSHAPTSTFETTTLMKRLILSRFVSGDTSSFTTRRR
jgi:hypothetical protein